MEYKLGSRANMPNRESATLRFGPFEMDLRSEELRKQGTLLKLPPQPFKLLALLAQNQGQLVTREELQRRLWGNETHVDYDVGLNSCIKQIRSVLNDTSNASRYIETLPKRGYRFIAPVESRFSEAVVGGENPENLRRVSPAVGAVHDLPRALLSIVLISIVAALVGLGYLALEGSRSLPSAFGTNGSRIMLAVLPFDNLTGDTDKNYLADGVTQELITHLSGLRPSRLGVIARTSAMQYRDTEKTVVEIGAELNVSFILEGSLRVDDNRIRINGQLVRVDDQATVWSGGYERELQETIALQRDVAQRVTRALSIELLSPARAAQGVTALTTSEAYDTYLKGRYFLNRGSGEDIEKGVQYFLAAIEADPFFASAQLGLAEGYLLLGQSRKKPAEDFYQMAKHAARKAVDLQPTLAEAHFVDALATWYSDWDWERAGAAFERAIQFNPGLAKAHHWYAYYLSSLGQHGRAIAEVRIARQLDPLSPLVNSDVGWFYYFAGSYDQAIEECRRTLELEPGFLLAHACLVESYDRNGKDEEALAEALESLAAAGATEEELTEIGKLDPSEGRENIRRWWLTHRDDLGPYARALIHLRLGEQEQALEFLEESFTARDLWLPALREDPRFDSLRSEPRFETLYQRLNFPSI